MVLHECPFCHRSFEAQVLSKEEVDSSEATKVGDFPVKVSRLTGQVTQGGFQGPLLLGLGEDERTAVAMHPEAFITYKLSYECKHCGKKWTKLEVEKKALPRAYLVDEEEVTDSEARVEEEEAREEEYAR